MAHSPAAQHAPLFICVCCGAVMSVLGLEFFWLLLAICLWRKERERERERFCHYRLTAKLCLGCCGNKTLDTSRWIQIYQTVRWKQGSNFVITPVIKEDSCCSVLVAGWFGYLLTVFVMYRFKLQMQTRGRMAEFCTGSSLVNAAHGLFARDWTIKHIWLIQSFKMGDKKKISKKECHWF